MSGQVGEFFIKADPFVAVHDRFTGANLHISVAQGKGDVGDLVTTLLPGAQFAANSCESFEKESLDEIWLKLVGFHAFHLFTDRHDFMDIHAVFGEGMVFDQLTNRFRIKGFIDDLVQSLSDFGVVAITDGFDEQVAERFVVEGDVAKHIKDLAIEGFALLLELFEETLEDETLARFVGNQVPKVADLGLPDAMDASKALFEAVGVPGEVVVDHQVGTLEVDAFAGGIGSDEDADFFVLLEEFFHFAAVLTQHPAMNCHDCLVVAQKGADAVCKIAQGITMFGEDDQLLAVAFFAKHSAVGLEEFREFTPFMVFATLADVVRHAFKPTEGGELCFELGDGLGSRGLIDDTLFGFFKLFGGKVFVIVVFVICPNVLTGAFAQFFFCQAAFEAFAPAFEGLIDRFRGRCQTSLQNGKGKTDGVLPLFSQIISPVELFLHILSDSSVECGFFRGK